MALPGGHLPALHHAGGEGAILFLRTEVEMGGEYTGIRHRPGDRDSGPWDGIEVFFKELLPASEGLEEAVVVKHVGITAHFFDDSG